MRKVTLVGAAWAKPGTAFLNQAPCEVAASCPVAKACQNLVLDRPYRVVEARPIQHDVCTVHEGGVRAAVVERIPIQASLDESKTRGTMARWTSPLCHVRGCPNWDRCFPRGLTPGSDLELHKVGSKMTCPMGYNLVEVEFDPPVSPGSH